MGILFRILLATIFVVTAVTKLNANIDYLVIQSAEYYRTLSRNAALDGADIVNYNPAGCAFLKDGLHVNVANQFVPKLNYSIGYEGKDYESKTQVWLLPSMFAVGKIGRVAVFGAFTIPAGGGAANYKNGLPLMPKSTPKAKDIAMEIIREKAAQGIANNFLFSGTYDDAMELVQDHLNLDGTQVTWEDGAFLGSSMYLAGTLGLAVKATDFLSISGAIRYVNAHDDFKGFSTYRINPSSSVIAGSNSSFTDNIILNAANATINGLADSLNRTEVDATKSASGFGAIFGIDLKPMKNLNVGFRCETATPLKWTEKVKDGKDFSGMYVDGRKYRYDLPMMLASGVNFDPFSWLTLTASFNYYLLKMADTGPDSVDSVGGYSDHYGNPYNISAGIEYRPFHWLGIGTGYQYSCTTGNDSTYNDNAYALPSHAIGGGIRFLPRDFLAITIGAGKVFFIPGHDATGQETFKKDSWAFAIGIDYLLKRC